MPPDEEKEEPMANGWNWPAANDPVVFDGTYVGASSVGSDDQAMEVRL